MKRHRFTQELSLVATEVHAPWWTLESTVEGRRLLLNPTVIPAWTTILGSDEWEHARQLRGRVWNIHMRLEALRSVLRVYGKDEQAFDRDRLWDYLSEEASDLTRLRAHGLPSQPAAASFALGYSPLASDDVMERLFEEVLSRSKGLERRLRIFTDRVRPLMSVDRIEISRVGVKMTDNSQHVSDSNVGAMISGNAHVEGGTFQGRGGQAVSQHWEDFASEVTMSELASDLSKLCEAVRSQASTPEQFEALAEVSRAEEAARQGDSHAVGDRLRKAGQWVFGIATQVGTTLAARALAAALGV